MRHVVALGVVLTTASLCVAEQKPATISNLIQQLSSNDFHLRHAAARQLGNLGLAARDAVPSLGKALHDPFAEVRASAGKALGQIGAPAVGELVKSLKDRDSGVRIHAAQALGQAGPDDKEAVPALIEVLKDSNADVRKAVVDALGEMGVEGKEAAPQLARLFHDPSVRVREHVRAALASIGPAAVEPLCDALGEEKVEVRLDAIKTIALFGPQAKKAVPSLRHAMKDEDQRIRASAAEALGEMRTEGADAAPELLAALRDKSQRVHDKAANTLVLMTMDGVPDLLEKVRAAERKGQWMAQGAVAPGGGNPLTPLIKDLSDKEPQVRIKAALTLGTLGAQARAALPALTRALSDESAQVRFSAAMSIAHIQRDKAENQLAVTRILREIRNQIEDLQTRIQPWVRPGTVNPIVQGQLRDFVMTYITVKASARLHRDTHWLDTMLQTLGTEAVPALVDGVNYVAGLGLGDC
jgi:HEAT repeat protein